MSTSPTEHSAAASPDTPANGSSGPDMIGQVKADANTIGASALKGAARGGLTGAALGAAKGAVKTSSGRKVIAVALLAPVLAVAMTFNMVSGAISASSVIPVGREATAHRAGLEVFEDVDDYRAIRDVASRTGLPWEILGGVYQYTKNAGAGVGSGPFGIDIEATGGDITAEAAADTEEAGLFVARRMVRAAPDTFGALSNPGIDAGYMNVRGPDGTSILEPAPGEEATRIRDEVKKQYVAALKTVPLKGNPAAASAAFDAALKLATGEEPSMCTPAGSSDDTFAVGTLTAKQAGYAQAIINQVAAKGMPEKAAVIAMATALQESGLKMWWNRMVPGSQELSDGGPEGGHDMDAFGQVSYSVGLFQQQVNGSMFSWGTVQDAMNPTKSTDMFLEALLRVPGWETMPVTVAAQTVQVSAFPLAYADDEMAARKILADLKPTTGSYGSKTTSSPAPAAGTPAAAGGCPTSGTATPGTGAAGKGDDYPFKDAQIFTPDPWGLFYRECTSFAAWRLNVQMGYKPGGEYPFTVAKIGVGLFGDGGQWGNTLGSKYPVDKTPKVGAVAWWGPYFTSPTTTTEQYGHVGIVGAVNPDGTVLIEEYNWGYNHNYHSRTIPAGDVTGYIHVADIG